MALGVALVTSLAARRADAWQEAHQTGDDAHVIVDASGVASVQHELRWRVVRGPLKSIDLLNVDPSAVLEPRATIVAGDGRTLGAQVVRRDDRTVRVTFDEPRALMHGSFTFDVSWRIDLVASRAISRDDTTWRLALSAPVAVDGFDGARSVIELSPAPNEPRPIAADTGAIDDSAVATLRRGPERDVLELVRPHVARGESVTWTLRVDPLALSHVVDTWAPPSSEANPPPEPDRARAALLGIALVGLALAFGLLVAHKERAFAHACAARGGIARAFLPLPDGARAPLAGVALAAAVGFEVAGEITVGAGCVALAILASTMSAPTVIQRARGPGQWLALRPEQAFTRHAVAGHWLDIGSAAGRVSALIAAALVVAAAGLARHFGLQGAWAAGLDTAVLVPVFVTGRASQLPPHGARSAAPWLALAFRSLRALSGVRVAPWARVAPDGIAADELRLLVVPRVAMPGFIGLEIGLAWNRTPVGWAAMPEVLARVLEGSAAAVKLAREVPGARTMPGRRPDERVVRLLPRLPSRSSTVALIHGLADALTDRRMASAAASPPEGRRSGDLHVRAIECGERVAPWV
jgi:hypothetical protein